MGRGGQERQLRLLLSELRKYNIECGIIVWNTDLKYNTDLCEIKNIGVYVLTLPEVSNKDKILRSRQFIKNYNATSLHSFTFYLNFFTSLICFNSDTFPIGGIRSRLILLNKVSGSLRFFLCSLFPRSKISNNRIFLMGLKYPFLSFLYDRTEIVTNQLSMENRIYNEPDIGDVIKTRSLSRLYPEKDLFMLLEVLDYLNKKGFKVQHEHAGNGPLKDALELEIAKSGLSGIVKFVGEIDNIEEFLQSGNIFLHTAKSEGYPNVIMEAMAIGRPIITTKCGDAEDLVIEGLNGFLTQIGDVKDFANKLLYMLENREYIKKMAMSSFLIAQEKFTLSQLPKATILAYKEFGIKINH